MIAITIVLKSLAAVFAKQAALTSIGGGLYGIVINVWLLAEICALCLEAVFWTMVLRRHALTVAYPFMSLVFGLNLAAAWLIFNETIEATHIVGIAIIVVGVILTNTSKER